MKKILYSLIIISLIIISNILINFYSVYNENKIFNSTYQINVTSYTGKSNYNTELSKIIDIAQNNHINIYKNTYPLGNDKTINLYAGIGNTTSFIHKFKIKLNVNDSITNILDNSNNFISNSRIKNTEKKGTIKILNNKTILNIYGLNNLENNPLTGVYFIQGNHIDINNIITKFDKIGLIGTIMNKSDITAVNIHSASIIYKVITLIILSLLISLTYGYYILSRYKEIASKKLFGYSNKKVFITLFNDTCIIYGIAIAISFMIELFYLYIISNLSGIFDYMLFNLIMIMIISIIHLLFDLPIVIFSLKLKVNYMLKNKKPLLPLQVLTIYFKFITSIILISIIVALISNIVILNNQKNSLDKWNSTKNYAFLEYRMSPNTMCNPLKLAELSFKNKKLFDDLNNSGSILIKQVVEHENRPNYSLNCGNSLQINSTYLKLNPIYDENGKRVSIANNYGDYLIVLVPKMYKNEQKSLIKSFTNWYQFKKYANINFYYQAINKKLPNEPKVKVKIIYIQNNQKTFLYRSNNTDTSVNSILAIINSKNIGSDSYLNYMASGDLLANIAKGYSNLNKDIIDTGMNQYVFTKVCVYNRIINKINTIIKSLNSSIYSVLILILAELIFIVFMTLNYLERSKYINNIKHIFGYSYIKIHYIFISEILATWIIIFLIINCLTKFSLIKMLSISIFCIIEIIISIIIINLVTKNKIIHGKEE